MPPQNNILQVIIPSISLFQLKRQLRNKNLTCLTLVKTQLGNRNGEEDQKIKQIEACSNELL